MPQNSCILATKEEILKYTKPLKILYVEDDELIARTAISILDRYFDSVDYASDGEEGLKKYKSSIYDIVISDIQMPNLDGMSMVKEIKEINPGQNIIITSASDDSEKLISLIDIGVEKFLLKPIKREKLLNTIYLISKNISIYNELSSYKKHLEDINKYNQEEQEKAREKQVSIISNDLKDDNGFLVDIIYKPSEILSGDSYSLYKKADGSIFIYIMDAMGHGILPSLTSFAISSAVKKYIESQKGMNAFSKEFIKTIKNTLVEEEQLSCVFLDISNDFKKIDYFSAGMYPPVLKDGQREISLHTNNHPLMNFDEEIKVDRIELEDFKSIALFTDGVLEFDNGLLDLKNTRMLLDREFFLRCIDRFKTLEVPDDITMIRIEKI